MFPWNLFTKSNSQIPDWMKYLDKTGMDKQLENFISHLSSEQLGGAMKSDFFSNLLNKGDSRSSPDDEPYPIHIFETNDYVFVRIPIKQEEDLNSLKIFHTSNKIMIEGLSPNPEQKQSFVLPASVKKKGAKTSIRDHILEITLLRNSDTQFTEISVPEW